MVMKKKRQKISHRGVYCHAAIAFLLTIGIAWTAPLAFSGFRADQPLSRFWLFLSDSGAQWGTGPLLLLATILVMAKHSCAKARILRGIHFLGGVVLVLGAFAATNEFVTKPFIASPRPYVLKLEAEGLLEADAFYALPDKKARSAFLRKTLEENSENDLIKSLDPAIREHWEHETGFSFPSGHSINAFLFAVFLAFLIQGLFAKGKGWVWLPFLWACGICLSRIAVGAHSPLDVTVGAFLGGLLGCLLLTSGLFDKVIPAKPPEQTTGE
jgi:phosphatidylglycerophosphatase B